MRSPISSRTRRKRRLGAVLMTGSMAVGIALGALGPAGAQQAEEEPDEVVELEVEKTAYYTSSAGESLPDTLTSEFPPGVVCVVAPELCPDELAPVTDAIGGVVGEAEGQQAEPAQPVQPGTLPVGYLGGETRYRSALKVVLPAQVSEGDTFVLRLPQTDPSYGASSPLFRQAVLAAVASAGDGAPNQEEFMKVFGEAPAEMVDMGVEACPVAEQFEAGENQDDTAAPAVDCIYGSNGTAVETDEGIVWEFDLSFTVDAWKSGMLENRGIFFRPTGAPNLAFGDPDTSYNARVTFTPAPTAAIFEAAQPAPPPSSGSSSNTGSTSQSAPPPSTTSSTPPSSTFAAPPAQTTDQAAQSPVVAPDPEPAGGAPAGAQQPVATAGATEAGSAWWIWLLVPVFAAGMWLTAQSLTAEAALATERQGAMSRLISQRRAASAAAGGSTSTAAPAV